MPAAGKGGGTLYGVPVKLTGSIAGYVIVLPIGLDDVSVVGHYSVYSVAGTVKLEGMSTIPTTGVRP